MFLRVFFFCFFYRNIQRLFSCTHLGPSVGIIMGVIFYASVGSGLTGRPGPDYLPVVTGAVVVAAAPAEVVVVVTPAEKFEKKNNCYKKSKINKKKQSKWGKMR